MYKLLKVDRVLVSIEFKIVNLFSKIIACRSWIIYFIDGIRKKKLLSEIKRINFFCYLLINVSCDEINRFRHYGNNKKAF